jgi:DNA-binding response OmpR family regulator
VNVVCCITDRHAWAQLEAALARNRMHCERVDNEVALLRTLRRASYDMIIVEVSAQSAASQGFFSWLGCRSGETTPVVMLGSGLAPEHIAEVFDAGADDYCDLPLEPIAFMARLRALLRRSGRTPVQRTIEHCGFVLDREASTLRDRGVPVELTPREFTMAWLFFSMPGVFISRDTLSVAIWGVDSEIASRTLEQHVYKLRKKLMLGPERGVLLRTAYTQGYRLELQATAAAAGTM